MSKQNNCSVIIGGMEMTVYRLHERGKPIRRFQTEDNVARGNILLEHVYDEELRRSVPTLSIFRQGEGSSNRALLIPSLCDFKLHTFGDNGMMLSGVERVDGVRYYQGWWIKFG